MDENVHDFEAPGSSTTTANRSVVRKSSSLCCVVDDCFASPAGDDPSANERLGSSCHGVDGDSPLPQRRDPVRKRAFTFFFVIFVFFFFPWEWSSAHRTGRGS